MKISISQNIDQNINGWKLSLHCEYGNTVDDRIWDQVISPCLSSKLRKSYLTEPDFTLEKIIQISQAMDSAFCSK